MNLKDFIKFCERRLHRIIYKVIYKNIYIYQLGVFLSRHTNFLLPHEEDICGLNYLNLDKKKYIVDVGASDGLYFKSVRSIGIKNKFISFEPLKKNIKHLSRIKKKNKNFKFYTLALGNKNGLLTIYTPIYENKLLYNWSPYSKKESEKI